MSEKYKLSTEEINQCMLNSPYALPNSPADKGLGAGQIKKYFYQFIHYLAEKLNIHLGEIGADYEKVILAVEEMDGVTLPNLIETDRAIREELSTSMETHNTGADSHADIRKMIEKADSLASNAYNLAGGKAKIHPSFSQTGMAFILRNEKVYAGDMIVFGKKNLPELMVYETGGEINDGDIACEYMDMISETVALEPGNFYYYTDSYADSKNQKVRFLAIESGIDTSLLATKEELEGAKEETNEKIGDIETALDGIISIQNSLIGGES